jgi:hypothetical protein
MKFENVNQTDTAHNGLTTSHARLCRSLALAPGLFQPFFDLSKKERPKLYVEINEKNATLILEGPHALDAYDAKTLATLVALSGPNGLRLTPKPKSEIGQITRILLDPKDVCKADTLFVMTSPTTILREMGISRGVKPLIALTDSLRRLSGVILFAAKDNEDEAIHLMAYHKNEETGRDRICVALNPIIAGAITGGQHVRIDMDELRTIKKDATTILYMRLCSMIDWPTGRKTKTKDGLSNAKSFKLATLTPYIWPNKSDNQSTTRTRHQKLREALDELAGLPHWSVTEYVKNTFRITRLHHSKAEVKNSKIESVSV